MKRIPEEDLSRIHELAEEFNVPVYIIRSLYDVMPNELYDGIVVALEDLEAEGWPEKSCGVDSTLDYKDSEDGKDD